jgi:hypothetical protein
MGMLTQAAIAAWQEKAGIEPATGERAGALEQLSQACFELIKIIELERSGIRDGDGYWHGSDVVGGMLRHINDAHQRLMEAYRREDEDKAKALSVSEDIRRE